MGHFHPENLEKAILAVTSRKMNQSQAAHKYGVTQSLTQSEYI
jgi:Trm5-related predicted tRNA methylase